jgi:transducin (beta)-like 1
VVFKFKFWIYKVFYSYNTKNIFHTGIFKDTGHSFKKKLRGLHDVRSASFHPIDPVLACGLFKEGLVFICGSSHTTSLENWEIERKHILRNRTVLSIQWNVSP